MEEMKPGNIVHVGGQIIGVLQSAQVEVEHIDVTTMKDTWKQTAPGRIFTTLKVQTSGPDAIARKSVEEGYRAGCDFAGYPVLKVNPAYFTYNKSDWFKDTHEHVTPAFAKLLGHPDVVDRLKFQPTTKKEKKVKIRNRFYVGHTKMSQALEQAQENTQANVPLANGERNPVYRGSHLRWSRPTLKAAIEHAEQILEKNPNQDHAIIVQIVRVVRRKKQPLVVEVVK